MPRLALYTLPDSGPTTPDENFARELMQLFTIGLIERNADFSPIEIGGEAVPTYTQRTITELSRVLTGFNFACSGDRVVAGQSIARNCNCSGIDCQFSSSAFFGRPPSLTINNESGLLHPDNYEPMVCYPRYHDTGRGRRGFQLPGSEVHSTRGCVDRSAGRAVHSPAARPAPPRFWNWVACRCSPSTKSAPVRSAPGWQQAPPSTATTQSRRRRAAPVMYEDEVSQRIEEEARFTTIEQVSLKLGEKCRNILEQFYFHAVSMENIARQFGYGSVQSAKVQKYKCIETARKMTFEKQVLNESAFDEFRVDKKPGQV